MMKRKREIIRMKIRGCKERRKKTKKKYNNIQNIDEEQEKIKANENEKMVSKEDGETNEWRKMKRMREIKTKTEGGNYKGNRR